MANSSSAKQTKGQDRTDLKRVTAEDALNASDSPSFYGLGKLFDTSSVRCPLVGYLHSEVQEALGIPEAPEGQEWKIFLKAKQGEKGAYWSFYLGLSDIRRDD